MERRRTRQPQRQGFTLIEVLLVLAILVVLGSLAVSMFTSTQRKADIRAARAQIGLFETPIGEYRMDMKQFPPSLEALISPTADVGADSGWAGPYMEINEIPLDPWRQPYQYVAPGTRNPQTYDLWSFGPDGVDGTEDDIGNW